MSTSKRTVALSGALLALLALPVFAGGPLNLNPNDPAGVERWPGGGLNIPFNPDGVPAGGPGALALGPRTYTQAVNDTLLALSQWQSVPTATQTYSNNGPMPFDVDATNFAPFIQNLFFGTNTADGFSPVVYDQDGSIFLALFGVSGVLGFASPDTRAANGDPIEAVCFLNGGAILGGFPDPDFDGVIVHEFGHYSGLAHTVTNGENVFFGDETGPTPINTYGNSPINLVETMYPFAGTGIARNAFSPHADDIAILSFLYPSAGFFASSGTVTGSVLAPNNTTPLTGVNVIARNVADPFVDAVSAISGDRGTAGVYTLNGLTPGASYTIHIDQILAGGFSTPPLSLPGPEEFYSGAAESNNVDSPDTPGDSVTVSAAAGATVSGVDVILNAPAPGDALPVGDDGSVELFLPFDVTLCGQTFDSLFVNANGNVTFGVGDADFTESVPDMLGGPPRIAGVWDDLNPTTGGIVTFDVTPSSFSVIWDDVPEWFATGSNSFEITLFDTPTAGDDDDDDDDDGGGSAPGNPFAIAYGGVGVADGLAGFSCGGAVTTGFETESDLSALLQPINAAGQTAIFELFSGFDNDLDNLTLDFTATTPFVDGFEPNNSTANAARIRLPFDTVDNDSFTAIAPTGGDVDYFRFKGTAGETLIAEIVAGQLDSVLGLFQAVGSDDDDDDDGANAVLVAADDDGGTGLLSRLVFEITESATYFLAVSSFPDFDFDGNGGSGGRYVLDALTVQGSLLSLGDDNSVQVGFGFNFPYQGSNHSSVFVNSNGNLTFGGGDFTFSESVSSFLSGAPRIAPLWDDLSPNNGGLVVANEGTDCLRIGFIDVPEFFNTGANNFEVVFDAGGNVNLNYGSLTATDGLAGITEGNGASDPGASDLSAGGPFSATGTTYEQFGFGNPNDLAGSSVVFGSPIAPCGVAGGGGDDDDN